MKATVDSDADAIAANVLAAELDDALNNEKRRRAIARQWSRIAPGVVYLDPRVGSKEYRRPFQALGVRCTVAEDNLIAGDFLFRCGHTRANPFCDGDYGCRLGVERKTLSDMVGSLLKNRMGKQIPDLLESLDLAWIVVEGIWRPGHDDCIETWRAGGWQPAPVSLTYSQLSSWLVRYDVMGRGKLKRWRTSSPTETVAFIASVFRWWQKEWGKHQEISVSKMPPPIKALMFRPTWLHRNAASLPEVGVKGMARVFKAFASIHEMINASEEQWVAALGSKADARTVWHAIRRRYR